MYNWLKAGAFIAAGHFLKHRIKGLSLLAAFWLIVWLLHGEYTSYVELSGDTAYLVHASLIKIGLYVVALLVYLFAVEGKVRRRSKSKAASKDDGFDFLRDKKKLRSRAEQLLEKE